LKVGESEVDLTADISEYGLDSINVMLLVAKLREDLGVQLDPRELVGSCRTLTALVDHLLQTESVSNYQSQAGNPDQETRGLP
jgi:acyl carrier protein